MFLLIVFYLESFPHEGQVYIFLQNLYDKMILPTLAMYGLEKVVEHGVLESACGGALSCDKCES